MVILKGKTYGRSELDAMLKDVEGRVTRQRAVAAPAAN
jgi:hypothetical protein